MGFGDAELGSLGKRDLDCDYYVRVHPNATVGTSTVYTRTHYMVDGVHRGNNVPTIVTDGQGGRWDRNDGEMVVSRNGLVVSVLAATRFVSHSVLDHFLMDLRHHTEWSNLERDSQAMLNGMNPLVAHALLVANGVLFRSSQVVDRNEPAWTGSPRARRHRMDPVMADTPPPPGPQPGPPPDQGTSGMRPTQEPVPPVRPRGRRITLD